MILGVEWMVVGSAAAAVRGVDVIPRDVDILLPSGSPESAKIRLAQALRPWTAAASPGPGLDMMLSTTEHPWQYSTDGSWLFGRWTIDGSRLEVAGISGSVGPNVLWETQGDAVCGTRQVVTWQGRALPVVPLEVFLATLLVRNRPDQVTTVIRRLIERGYCIELIERACQDRGVVIPALLRR